MYKSETLKDFYGRIIGFVETDSVTGNKVGKDFYHRVVGFYDKKLNITKDFYHRIVGQGDILTSLISQANEKNTRK